MGKVGIIIAMDEELNELLPYLKNKKEIKIFNLSFYEGLISNQECILVLSGIGKVNAARACQILIDNMNVDYVINIGVAAGINKNLMIGDIVIGTKLVQHDFDITSFGHPKGYITGVGQYILADNYLINLFEKSTTDNVVLKKGVIASGDIFCTEPQMALKIKTKFDALCVEMEGASIAQVCFLSGIPFIVVRSISDIPNNENQIDFEHFLKESSEKVAKILVRTIAKINDFKEDL